MKKQYAIGYAVEIRLGGFAGYDEKTGRDVHCALPNFAYMPLLERLDVWAEFSRYLRAKGVGSTRLQGYWRNLRICTERWQRQREFGRGYREEQAAQRGLLARVRNFKLTPEQFKYDRAVGVEIECYGPPMEEKLPYWAREKGDGSLGSASNGIEFNLLLKREYLEPRLFRFCDMLSKYGHKVDKTCGLHVHLDMRGKSEDEVTRLARKLDKWLYALRELVPASRRDNNYCQFGISSRDRYKAVNLCAFEKFKTLEVRLHSGSCDYTKIVSWIRLVELCAAMPKAPRAGLGCIATLETLPLPAHEAAYWMARHRELNPRIYNTVSTSAENESGTLRDRN